MPDRERNPQSCKDAISAAPSRRSLLAGAGAAAAATMLAACNRAGEGTAAAATDEAGPEFWTAEYSANKSDVRLAMYRKRVGAPVAGENKPVLFLVHGSSMSSLSTFDLDVPEAGEYSLMNVFARYGYDVWTMDFEGYGRSTVTDGNSDIASGVRDLAAATEVVAAETGVQRYHFFGTSSGALRAGAFASEYPDRAGRLVLGALTYTGRGSPTLTDRAQRLDFYRNNNRRPRDIELIRSIFTRDHPGSGDPRVANALADAELPYGETVPTGTYLDMTANLPVVDPLRIQSPVLVIRGEFDGIATEEDLWDFYRQLPNLDKQYIILPGLAHSLHLGINRQLAWHAVQAFLTLPEPVPV